MRRRPNHLVTLSYLLLAVTAVVAVATTTRPTTSTELGKYALRLVYSESFPDFCTKEDSTALFHLISETLRGGNNISHKTNKNGKKKMRKLVRSVDPVDCSAECAWASAGQCTVIKPWLAGPCNDWQGRRNLEAVKFDSFLDFTQQVANEQVVLPTIGTDQECTEALLAVRMALQQHATFSTTCAHKVFGKPIEVECFRGYV
jgi:hypothetical protein